MAGGYTGDDYRRIADHVAKQLGVEDDGKLSAPLLDALAAMDKDGEGTHPVENDRRFPNTNQAAGCWTAVNEYQYCVKVTGDATNPKCLQRRRDYFTICPTDWLESYQEQLEAGTYMGIGDATIMEQEDDEDDE